jgi:hypothetical protein
MGHNSLAALLHNSSIHPSIHPPTHPSPLCTLHQDRIQIIQWTRIIYFNVNLYKITTDLPSQISAAGMQGRKWKVKEVLEHQKHQQKVYVLGCLDITWWFQSF